MKGLFFSSKEGFYLFKLCLVGKVSGLSFCHVVRMPVERGGGETVCVASLLSSLDLSLSLPQRHIYSFKCWSFCFVLGKFIRNCHV